MDNKQWVQQWLGKRSYTKEDILKIAGQRSYFEPDSMKEDIGKILGPTPNAETSSGPSGTQYP